MPAFYDSPVSGFINDDAKRILGILISSTSNLGFAQHENKQTTAWEAEIDLLQSSLEPLVANEPTVQTWHVLFEYPIPRRQKRIDVVLLAYELIFVLEFKIGAKTHDSFARRQIEDYALDLRDFHAQSRDHLIFPILISTNAPITPTQMISNVDCVYPTQLATKSDMGSLISGLFRSMHKPDIQAIDPKVWNTSAYHAVPTVIEAAELLYAGHNVREISTSHAGITNLSETTDHLIETLQWAQQTKSKAICFVTGIPGAGKTLEAQRAWNAAQEFKKFQRDVSEPAMMLSIMDRFPDWSVIIALVGGGQEIHDGEAGLAEWGKTMRDQYPHWHVFASPEAIVGGPSLAGSRLFMNAVPNNLNVHTDPLLHVVHNQ